MDRTDREMVTVLVGGIGAEKVLRPLILFDGVVHLGSGHDGTGGECLFAVNPSGVMDQFFFTNNINNQLPRRLIRLRKCVLNS